MGLDFFGVQISARILVPQKIAGGGILTREYPLWIGGGAGTGSGTTLPAALQDLSYVQDVNIQIGLGLNSKVSLTLNMPQEEGIQLIHSELLSWAASELRVQIGYSTGQGALSMEFGGLMMKPDVRIGNDVTVTLNALGVAYGLNLSNATSQPSFPPPISPWQAVKQTLQLHTNINLGTDGTDATVFPDFTAADVDPNNPKANAFFRPVVGKKASTPTEIQDANAQIAAVNAKVGIGKGKITQSQADEQIQLINSNIHREDQLVGISKGPKNDWWFIRETIKNYGLELLVRDNTITIHDPEKWRMDPVKYTFILKGNIDTDKLVYPILEFSSPSTYVWLGSGVGGVLTSDVSADNKKAIETLSIAIVNPKPTRDPSVINASQAAPPAAAPNLSGPGLAGIGTGLGQGAQAGLGVYQTVEQIAISRTGKGAYDSASGAPDAYQVFPGSPDDARAEQAANELRNYNNNRGIQCEVTTLGVPELLPAAVIQLQGLAPDGMREEDAWFDGKYGVMMVEHTIGTGGMYTKFKGIKNFFPGKILGGISDPSKMGGTVNLTPAPSTSAANTPGGLTGLGTITKVPTGD